MLCGVIGYAVALEEAFAHPLEALPGEGRTAMALGLLLFLFGPAWGMWRTTGAVAGARIVVSFVTAGAVYALTEAPPVTSLGLALAGVVAVVSIDEFRARRLPVALE
jgi:hypothetical protein